MSNDHHGVTVFPHVIEVAPEPEAPPIPGDVAAQLWSTYGDEWCIRLILKETTRGARESYAVGDTSQLVKPSAPEKFQQLSLLEAQEL